LARYNEVLAANQKLREEVDVVRRERVTYGKVRNDMEEELKKISNDTWDQATRHMMMQKAAETMKEKILKLKEKNLHDQATYFSEYEKLQVELEYMEEFLI